MKIPYLIKLTEEERELKRLQEFYDKALSVGGPAFEHYYKDHKESESCHKNSQ